MNTSTERPILRIRSPHDAVSAVPYILGFHPSDSMVAIGFGTPGETCAMRLDLPHPRAGLSHATAGHIGAVLSRNGLSDALLLGYGPPERVTPIVDAARRALPAHGVNVKEALRVADGRWWSYLCADPACCPPEGTPYDISTSAVAAEATLAGHIVYADRAELERTVAPIEGPARHAMRQATARAQERFLTWAADGLEPRQIRTLMTDEAIPLITALTARGTNPPPTDDEVAWLGILLTNLRIRDEAWVRTDPDDPSPHIELWRDILRRVEPPYTAAPACLLAYAAYTAGDGGLANVALDRATQADPAYSLALLLREVVQAAIPPSQARLKMTPEELSAAYAQQDAHPRAQDQ